MSIFDQMHSDLDFASMSKEELEQYINSKVEPLLSIMEDKKERLKDQVFFRSR